jgi:hypothetical protein
MCLSVFSRLGVKSGGCAVYHKTNRETMVEIGDSVRGKDIYIIQTGTKYDSAFCIMPVWSVNINLPSLLSCSNINHAQISVKPLVLELNARRELQKTGIWVRLAQQRPFNAVALTWHWVPYRVWRVWLMLGARTLTWFCVIWRFCSGSEVWSCVIG